MPGVRGGGRISGSRSSSGPKGSRSGPKTDEHTHRGTVYGHTGGNGTSVSRSDAPREDPVCYADLQVFVDCINTSPHDISVCQETFDAFIKCTDRRSWWSRYRDYLEL